MESRQLSTKYASEHFTSKQELILRPATAATPNLILLPQKQTTLPSQRVRLEQLPCQRAQRKFRLCQEETDLDTSGPHSHQPATAIKSITEAITTQRLKHQLPLRPPEHRPLACETAIGLDLLGRY